MTDEEKEAIEKVKRIIERYEHKPIGKISVEFDEFAYNLFKTILNLIEKQSKEIEELKEKSMHITKETVEFVNSHYIHNDKIKAKIEELEKEQEDNRKSLYNAVNILNFKEMDKILNRICVNMTVRDILQSLLEEK